jgi:hypothetical protein
LLQYLFPEQLWINIRNFVRNLATLPLWVNKDLSATVFETGRSPQGVQV